MKIKNSGGFPAKKMVGMGESSACRLVCYKCSILFTVLALNQFFSGSIQKIELFKMILLVSISTLNSARCFYYVRVTRLVWKWKALKKKTSTVQIEEILSGF